MVLYLSESRTPGNTAPLRLGITAVLCVSFFGVSNLTEIVPLVSNNVFNAIPMTCFKKFAKQFHVNTLSF